MTFFSRLGKPHNRKSPTSDDYGVEEWRGGGKHKLHAHTHKHTLDTINPVCSLINALSLLLTHLVACPSWNLCRIRPDRTVTRSAIDAPSARCVPQHGHQADRAIRRPTRAGRTAAAGSVAHTGGATSLEHVAVLVHATGAVTLACDAGRRHMIRGDGGDAAKSRVHRRNRVWWTRGRALCVCVCMRERARYARMYIRAHTNFIHTATVSLVRCKNPVKKNNALMCVHAWHVHKWRIKQLLCK